MQHQT